MSSNSNLKILYAIQATGNGHIARAMELFPHLSKFGKIDFFLSGSNSSLSCNLPIKFRSKGLSLFYRNNGRLDYLRILFQTNPIKLISEAIQLPVQEYDIVISDFEFISSLSCKLKRIHFFHIGHQASFHSKQTPRPTGIKFLSDWILRNYCSSSRNVGFHFSAYEPWILPPIIKQKIWDAATKPNVKKQAADEPFNLKHDFSYELFYQSNHSIQNSTELSKRFITIYLPQYSPEEIRRYLYGIQHVQFQIFHPNVLTPYTEGNFRWMKINNDSFSKSMIESDGIICGAGFETPAEALFLNKELLVIPISGQFEQYCNAESLKHLGVTVVERLDLNFKDVLEQWIKHPRDKKLKPNFAPTHEIVSRIFEDYIYPWLQAK